MIVEPVAGSTGVLIPPKGYLERLQGDLRQVRRPLIFDEVITGFGRLGTNFGADYFGVTPDMMTVAKGITSGVIPMGAVFAKKEIHDTFMTGPGAPHRVLPRLHLFGQPRRLRRLARHARHVPGGGSSHPRRRPCGLLGRRHAFAEGRRRTSSTSATSASIGAVELEPIAGQPAKRGFTTFVEAYDRGLLTRTTGDIIALSPPLIVSKAEIDTIVGILGDTLKALA